MTASSSASANPSSTLSPSASAGEVNKRRMTLRPLAMLVPYLAKYRWRVAAAGVALLAASSAALAVPMAVRRMIDYGFGAENAALIDQYFALMIAVVAALAGASALRYYLVTWLGERIVSDLRADTFTHVINLGADFFDGARSGEVMSRLTADTTQIKSAVGVSISTALRNFVLFVGAITLMVVTSPRLSAFVLIAIPLIVLPIVIFGRKVRQRSRLAQDTLAAASAFANEAISGVRTLQSFTAERRSADRYGDDVETAFQAARSAVGARSLLTAGAIFVIFASVVAVLWVGAQDVLSGRLTGGELGQFVLYSVFAAGALGELSQVWGEVSQAAGAAERLDELLRTPASIEAPATPIPIKTPVRGALNFQDVTFAYPSAPDADVIQGLSTFIQPGETVAIVGPSGAGKSTLFALLMRWYDPQSGAVFLDDQHISDLEPQALRGEVALVPQDTTIFAGTIAENIGYGRPGATDREIHKAAEAANALEFVEPLKDGFHTMVGERGVTLSGGQRQRIAIARAILKDAPVLLLDEATSALDAESETLVQGALERLMAGRTTLVIAHRLATVLKADRILVIDQGRIVEEGRHGDLVDRPGGLYARLAHLQFQTSPEAAE